MGVGEFASAGLLSSPQGRLTGAPNKIVSSSMPLRWDAGSTVLCTEQIRGRASSPTRVTQGSALPPARGSNGHLSLTPCHHMTDEGSVLLFSDALRLCSH